MRSGVRQFFARSDKQYRYAQLAEKYPPENIKIKNGIIVYDKPQSPREPVDDDPRIRRLEPHELEVVRTLGYGGFGSVAAVRTRRRDDSVRQDALDILGAQMAIKILHKRHYREDEPENEHDIKPHQDWKNVERQNLASLPFHPFISGLLDAFSDTRNLYLLTELAPCGTLSSLFSSLHPTGTATTTTRGLPTPNIRFYLANLVLALEFVHSLGLVHCDIKPGNILLGADGYLMLADFGLASRVDEDEERVWRGIGTTHFAPPEFLAPEGGEEDGKEPDEKARRHLDWWGLACCVFEMATGKMPFRSKKRRPGIQDSHDFTERIRNVKYKWPSGAAVDADLRNLIDGMFKKDPADRVGMTMGGVDEDGESENWRNEQLRGHAFMKGFQWGLMRDKRLVAPSVAVFYPDASQGWQHNGLVPHRKIPSLSRLTPPVHFQWDYRFQPHPAQRQVRAEQSVQQRRAEREWMLLGQRRTRKARRVNTALNMGKIWGATTARVGEEQRRVDEGREEGIGEGTWGWEREWDFMKRRMGSVGFVEWCEYGRGVFERLESVWGEVGGVWESEREEECVDKGRRRARRGPEGGSPGRRERVKVLEEEMDRLVDEMEEVEDKLRAVQEEVFKKKTSIPLPPPYRAAAASNAAATASEGPIARLLLREHGNLIEKLRDVDEKREAEKHMSLCHMVGVWEAEMKDQGVPVPPFLGWL